MERESCLGMLMVLVGGLILLACGWWPAGDSHADSARRREALAWRRIWAPVVPALAVASALCGWAMLEPDPVPEHVPISLIAASLPMGLLMARAVVRSVRSLVAVWEPAGPVTVGLLRPWVVFPPYLAKRLDDRQIAAVVEHESAHARHRDPLRIWLAQFASDLQWPWPQARERLRQWLIALELARDEETREVGIDGSELAEAIVAAARFGAVADSSMRAALIGERAVLKERIERLLAPARSSVRANRTGLRGAFVMLAPAAILGLAFGLMFGERLVSALFRIAA